MSDTLYIQTDMNILIKHPHVYLQDIARLSCSNSKVLNRLRVLPVANLNPDTPGRYTMSVMDLVDLIQKKEPDLDITPLGELSAGNRKCLQRIYNTGNFLFHWACCRCSFLL